MTHSFTKSPRYRVAIIGGAGKQGLEYAHVISRMPEWAKIAVVIDPQIEKCLDEVYSGVARYRSIEEAMFGYDFDIGLVAVPHYLHYNFTSMLLRKGKHVIKEKPFAINLQEASELFTLSQDHSKKIFITTQRCHKEIFDTIRAALAKIGSIYSFKYEYFKNFSKPTSGWRAARKLSCGGIILDMGYHVFDIILRLFGFPTHISAQHGYCFPTTRAERLEDLAEILLNYTDRQLQGSVLLARHHYKKAEKLEIIGDKGFAVVESDRCSVFTKGGSLLESVIDLAEKDTRLMLEKFFVGLSDDTFWQKDLLIHLDNMRLLDLIYRSARTHSTISL